MNYDNIPEELKKLKQWTCYRTYIEEGKCKKKIISPVTGLKARCNEPFSWAYFDDAKKYCEKYKFNGLTFSLTEGITFIDIDHARNKEMGEILSEEAKKLMNIFPDTFTESSVSGTGIHILIKGSLPADCLKRNDSKGIEMYDRLRFVCLTGNLLNGCKEIKDYSQVIEQVNYDFIGKKPPRICRPQIPNEQTDYDLIAEIIKSRQGQKFNELYCGDISGYESHSNADYSFISVLAWWTSDFYQIDRIYRSSGLYRPKWDRGLYNSTYGAEMINDALSRIIPRETKPEISSKTYFEM